MSDATAVVEFLTFDVAAEHLDAWMALEAEVWSGFLERQPGFLRKELWQGDDGTVHAVIWWESLGHWKSIDAATVASIDAQMGELLVEPTCRSFSLLRER